ncbi:MAG: hypothetical protein Q7T33_04390 [Dehalococcoidia bacterium]|nr:hypothetical protein [Dehalococcoidia bacterium]
MRPYLHTPRSPRSPLLLVVAALAAAVAVAACGGGEEDTNGPSAAAVCASPKIVHSPVDSRYLPIVISSDLAVGENRFSLGLIDQEDNTPVTGAQLHLRFALRCGDEARPKAEADPSAVTVTRTYAHTHTDGTGETHEAGEVGAYIANVSFDAPGTWQVEVTGKAGGQEIEPVTPTFSVNEKSFSLSAGDPAPRSVQPILKDVADIRTIDTSDPPIPEMHQMTVADAVTSGRPTVIVFATPAFCESQICGPTKSIVDDLFRQYGSQANFVHIEPYDVERIRNAQCDSLFECRSPLLDEWKLESEPWVFLIDKDGKIAGKYEGIVSLEELEAALQQLLVG